MKRIVSGILACLAIAGVMVAPIADLRAADAMQSTHAMQPVAMTTATAVQHMTVAMVDEVMPCCPPSSPATPDCQKGCPLASACLAKCVMDLARLLPTAQRLYLAAAGLMPSEFDGAGLNAPELPPEPPRT